MEVYIPGGLALTTMVTDSKFPPSNSCSQEIPSNFIRKFSMTTSICDSIFHDHIFTTRNFCDHSIHDHHSLKFLQPQISRMRHPSICRTYATPFLYDSHQRQKLPTTFFLPVVIPNRCEIPHHLICHMEPQ